MSLSHTSTPVSRPRAGAPRSEWWLLGGCLVVLALAAVSIYQLRSYARESVRAEDRLAQLQISINRLGALEWQAVAEGRFEPLHVAEAQHARERIESLLGDLRRLPAAAATLAPIEAAYPRFVDALHRQFALIAENRLDAARALDDEEVDPKSEVLSRALVAAATAHDRGAQRATAWAARGSLAILVTAALAIALLFREREGIRQAKRVALAEELARTQGEARFRALIQNAQDAILIVDVQGRIEYATPSVATVFSVSAENLAGTSITDWLDDEGSDRLRRLLQDCATREAPPPVEVRLLADERRLVEVVASNRRDDPLLGGLVLTCRDVSDRRQLEGQLRQSQKMDAIGQLAGGIAHDFNNLLAVITGFTEMLGRDLGPGHRGRARVEQIMKAAARAADLTRQLLAFSRKQTLQPAVLDLNLLVRDMEPMLRRLIGEQIEVVALTAGTTVSVMADKGQIEQVVMNLAVNARDAMPGGGRLLIETGEIDVDDEALAARLGVPRGPYVTLAVSDTGLGMDQKTASRVFEPFFTTKEVGKGTGLGLATVYGIVKQSGGHVEVYSENERGSTFRVYLPRVVGAMPRKPEPVDVPAPVAPHGRTVLLVEDDFALREFTLELLEEAGYTVLAAAHGAEALSLVGERSVPIDAIVTDVVMPGMTGPEMVERLRAGGATPKVLFISGYTYGAIGQQGVLLPGTHFLAKPFRSGALLDKLREIIDEGAPSADQLRELSFAGLSSAASAVRSS